MSLSYSEIKHVIEELQPEIIGQRVRKAFQLDEETIAMELRQPKYLVLSVHPKGARIHSSPKIEKWGKTLRFGALIRKHIVGLFLEGIEVLGPDRIIKLRFGRPSKAGLVAELTGRGGDMLVLDDEERVVGALHQEKVSPRKVQGSLYSPPEPFDEKKNEKDRSLGVEGSFDRWVASHYSGWAAEMELEKRKRNLEKCLTRQIKTLKKKLNSIDRALEKADEKKGQGKWGDLLLAHAHKIEPKNRKTEVPDLFEDGELIEIPLDPEKNVFENAQRYYKNAGRSLRTLELEGKRRKESAVALRSLQDLKENLRETGVDEERLKELEIQADTYGVFPKQKQKKQTLQFSRKPFRMFYSVKGKKILVGRSAKDNHELTFHIARGRDLWMHVTGHSGPHVIVRDEQGETDSETILDAATLAVYYTLHSRHGDAEVVYTDKKNVKPVKGAPGRVTYSSPKTLLLRMEDSRLNRLLAQ